MVKILNIVFIQIIFSVHMNVHFVATNLWAIMLNTYAIIFSLGLAQMELHMIYVYHAIICV